MGWETIQLLATSIGESPNDLESTISAWSIRIVALCSLVVIALLLYSSKQKRMKNRKKKTLFISITSLVLATTIFLFGTTIYINTISDSKGPVHWHTDIEFWACGTEIELRDPKGALSNKIGTSTYHEHNDKRIHLEGVVVDKVYDASLEKFMAVTNGRITDTGITIPTNPDYVEDDTDGDKSSGDKNALATYVRELETGTVLELKNGDMCGSEAGEVQAFVYTYDGQTDTYSQTKLTSPKNYIMRDESIVPPGDCLIVEFAAKKDRTDKLCLQYGVRDINKCQAYSGSDKNGKLCTIYEKTPTTTGGTQ